MVLRHKPPKREEIEGIKRQSKSPRKSSKGNETLKDHLKMPP